MDESDYKPRVCTGCGFCCRKAPCAVAQRVYGPVTQCPGLKWTGSQYRCDLMCKPGDIGARYREELYAGAGCCSPLNSDRRNIPPPASGVPGSPLSKQTQALLRCMARAFMSGDQLWLTIEGASKDLGKDWCKAAHNFVREERDPQKQEFMG